VEEHSNPRTGTPTDRDPANPTGLGVTRCTSCGQPESVVGKLGLKAGYTDTCDYCANGLDRYEVLADELQAIVWPCIDACRARDVSDRDIEEVFDIVEQRFLEHVAKAKGHYPAPEAGA
jgi:hypothetical protein